MMMDMEFEKLVNLLPSVAINTMAAREHVGEIEQKVRVIKEKGESQRHNKYSPIPSITKAHSDRTLRGA